MTGLEPRYEAAHAAIDKMRHDLRIERPNPTRVIVESDTGARDTPAGYAVARRLPGPLWRRWYDRQLERA